MDNLTIHKMNIVKYVYEKLNIMPILNIPYCPEFNPIESVFSQVKRVFKAERLKKLANLEPFDAEGCITDIFWNLKKETIQPCIRKSLHLLETA
jgi:transposase